MRKFLAALLAVMMIAGVIAAMPISAATEEPAKSDFDNSTSDRKMDGLIITEMLINSKTGVDGLDDQTANSSSAAVFKSPDAMDYIEVYNAGSEPVYLYQYCILSANYRKFIGEDTTDASSVKYQFTHKNEIKEGDIHAGASSDSKNATNGCENAPDDTINPGEFAIIWFWTSDTDTASATRGKSLASTDAGDTRSYPYFRDWYKMDSETKIFVTNAKKSSGQKDIYNSLETNWIYALAHKDYQLSDLAVTGNTQDTKRLQDDIYCMASYTGYNGSGIVTTDNMDHVSAYYVPSYCTPDLVNANNKKVAELEKKTEYKVYKNYVEIDCALSFNECAIISFTQEPSPGGMPSWQWQYIETKANLDHDPGNIENPTYGFGLEYIDKYVWGRAEAKVGTLVEAGNHNQKLDGITGVPKQLTGDSEMSAEDQAKETLNLYNELMKRYVSDWDDNTALHVTEGERAGRLIVSKTGEGDAAVYDWIEKAYDYMETTYIASIDESGNTGYKEDKKDYASGFVDREEQYKKWFENGKLNVGGNSFPMWALILIIVGGVLLVGGAVVVVIIVIKKKNKPVAADDVAAEGEIQVIDETAENTDEAPAEEVVAEEAPVEETPVEEAAPVEEENQAE